MMDNNIRRMWEESARLQEFHTRGSGYAGPSRQSPEEKAKDLARFREMERTIAANGAKRDAERAAAIAAQQAKPLPDILTDRNQGIYDMMHGPNGREKPTLDPKKQAERAKRAEKKR